MSKRSRRRARPATCRAKSTTPRPRRQLRTGKKAVYAALVAVLFFALLEGALSLGGIRPVLVDEDPYVGFASNIPLFVPRQRADGRVEMVTAENKLPWFNSQRFVKDKQRGSYRIFCLGGSTTYGRPYNDSTSFCGWLRELLKAADPDTRWEVVNAGGISYASYRVARLMEELVAYQPDLFIIYTGQNEFLEHRTFNSVRETPALVQRVGVALSHTRTYSAMRRLLRVPPAKAADRDTDRHLLPAEVKTRLDQGVGPDAFSRDDQLQQKILHHFELNVSRIVDIARAAGTQVMLVTPASNLRDCSPFKTVLRDDLTTEAAIRVNALLEAADRSYTEKNYTEALAAIDSLLEIDNRDAEAHFLRGRCLDQLGRYAEAKESYIRAMEEDVCPLRAVTAIRRSILQVADKKHVPCVDFERLAEQQSANGIPGENLFLDHVHPTIEGNRLLALAILDELAQQNWLQPCSQWGDEAIAKVTAAVESRVDQQANADALRNLAKVFTWAGKHEEANRMALRAAELTSRDANTLYLAGNALIDRGDLDAAVDKLQQAIAMNPQDAQAICSLGVAYQKRGQFELAEEQYQSALRIDGENASAHNNLAALYLAKGRWSEAASHLEHAIRINPHYAKAYHNLGVAYTKQSKWTEAIDNFQRAADVDPDFAEAHRDLGNLFQARGKIDLAVLHYRQALRLNATFLPTANKLSWLLSTSSEASIRDGPEALRLALRCAEATGYQQPVVLNTLAAAYAETGDFQQGVKWQEKALELAPEPMKPGCRQRLTQYQSGQPHRESQRP